MGVQVTVNKHQLTNFELQKLDKIAYSFADDGQKCALLAGSGEYIYVDKVIIYSGGADDTNYETVTFVVDESDASSEGGADTTTITIANTLLKQVIKARNAGEAIVKDLGIVLEQNKDLIVKVAKGATAQAVDVIILYKKL